MSDDPRTYMGLQIIVDITGRNQDEIWTAIEKVLCGACDTGERDCTIESMASCTLTDDLDGVFTWMSNEEPAPVTASCWCHGHLHDGDQQTHGYCVVCDCPTDRPAPASTPVRRVQAKNRWHAAWVIVRESFLHPNTETIIEWEEKPDVQHSETDATSEGTPESTG